MFEVHVRGVQRLNRRILQLAAENPRVAQRALREEAEIEMLEMKRRTPVDTGALRASGRVENLQGSVGIRWLFGGPAVSYAIPVHENLEAFHPNGQAKFMESVLVESMRYLPARVSNRMRALLRT